MSATTEGRFRVRPLVTTVIARFSETVIWRWLMRLLEIEFLDRATALAAKAFVALLPLIAVIFAVLPDGASTPWVESTADHLGVPTSELAGLTSIDSARASFGLIGLVVLVFYATSFGTSLQRLYRRAWRRPPSGQGGRLAILEWLALFVLISTAIPFIALAVSGAGAALLAAAMSILGGTALWTWTGRVLLSGQVRWRALWFGGLVTEIGLTAYGTASLIWFPQALESSESSFGAYGAAITMLAWLIGCAFIVVVVAALPPVIAESDNRISRLLVGSAPLEPDAPAPLPAPSSSPLRLWLPGKYLDEP